MRQSAVHGERLLPPGTYACIALLLLAALPAAPVVAGSSATTVRANVGIKGKQSKAWSGYPSISAGGRFVAFETSAKLLKRDTNRESDVFVHDRVERTTRRVSVSSSGEQGNGWSGYAAISGDGRFVAFTAEASNLVPGDTNGKDDVFVHDRTSGTTERVSVGNSGEEGDGDSAYPALSADGRFVAFTSGASNLVEDDTNGRIDVFVHDRATHVTKRVSVSSAGVEGDGSSNNVTPNALSADGRLVAFSSLASNLVEGDANGTLDVFVHDRKTGSTRRVSVSSAGTEGDATSDFASLSADGRFVAFQSYAANLVANDGNGESDAFLHNLRTGATRRVSVSTSGGDADHGSYTPTLSRDGRYVAFGSYASNLVAGDENERGDVFLHDRRKGTTRLVSVTEQGGGGNSDSEYPFLSASGRFVAFQSDATDLVAGDTNGETDVLVRGPLR